MRKNKCSERWHTASRKREGYTMIVVLCLMALFMALALSLILASSLSVSRALQGYAQEQCKASAISFSKVVEGKLGKEEDTFAKEIQRYIKDEHWPYYDEDDTTGGHNEVKAFKYFSLNDDMGSGYEDKTGKIKFLMYWQTNDEEAVNNPTDPDYTGSELVVKVTCTLRGQEHHVTTRYQTATDKKEKASESDEKQVWNGAWYRMGRNG